MTPFPIEHSSKNSQLTMLMRNSNAMRAILPNNPVFSCSSLTRIEPATIHKFGGLSKDLWLLLRMSERDAKDHFHPVRLLSCPCICEDDHESLALFIVKRTADLIHLLRVGVNQELNVEEVVVALSAKESCQFTCENGGYVEHTEWPHFVGNRDCDIFRCTNDLIRCTKGVETSCGLPLPTVELRSC
jgi:hypothetical protein